MKRSLATNPKRVVLGTLLSATLAFATLAISSSAFAGTHSYLNTMRSSTMSHIFVSQHVEGEYGKFSVMGTMPASETSEGGNYTKTSFWKGYGIGSTIGLEIMKFIHFTASHTFVNMANASDSLETLRGSRLNAGINLEFLAPIGNLELGGGITGSRLDYQNRLEISNFYGSGYYYSLAINHFVNSRLSFYGVAKISREHLDRSSGSTIARAMNSSTTLMGLGFRIWM